MSKAAQDRKYRREQIAQSDKAQSTFGSSGQVQKKAGVKIERKVLNMNKPVFCPFCLEGDYLKNFLVSTKKGLSTSKAQCPHCQSGMLLRTVLRKWTVEEYADWVFAYRVSGFWQKINFEKWSKNLEIKGWARDFWDRYKALKGEAEEERMREQEAMSGFDEEEY